jgi:hypothetical protein
MPRAFYDSLTLDFQLGGKSRVVHSCRSAFLTGQDLPVKGKNLPGAGRICRVRRFDCRKRNGAARVSPAAPPHVSQGFLSLQII